MPADSQIWCYVWAKIQRKKVFFYVFVDWYFTYFACSKSFSNTILLCPCWNNLSCMGITSITTMCHISETKYCFSHLETRGPNQPIRDLQDFWLASSIVPCFLFTALIYAKTINAFCHQFFPQDSGIKLTSYSDLTCVKQEAKGHSQNRNTQNAQTNLKLSFRFFRPESFAKSTSERERCFYFRYVFKLTWVNSAPHATTKPILTLHTLQKQGSSSCTFRECSVYKGMRINRDTKQECERSELHSLHRSASQRLS